MSSDYYWAVFCPPHMSYWDTTGHVTYVIWEVFFQLSNWLTPVGSCFLTDKLNVEERALTRPVHMTRGGTTHNSRRYVCHQILQTHIYLGTLRGLTNRFCLEMPIRAYKWEGFHFVCLYVTLSNPKVLVKAKPHPCSKALLIIAVLVVGGAEARPNGFGNFIPQTSTLMSTWSIAL